MRDQGLWKEPDSKYHKNKARIQNSEVLSVLSGQTTCFFLFSFFPLFSPFFPFVTGFGYVTYAGL